MPCGGPLYGYHYDPVLKVRTINEEEAQVVRQMFKWCFNGQSTYSIGMVLEERGIRGPRGGVLEARSVQHMLRNASYAGIDYYGEYRYKGSAGQKRTITARDPSERIEIVGFTPPIISKELFDAVQERLSMRQPRANSGRVYFLTRFTRCITCDGPIVGSCLAHKYPRYRCRNTARTISRRATCHERYIPAEELEHVVWHRVCEAVAQPQVLVSELREHFESGGGSLGDQVEQLRRDIAQVKREQGRLSYLYRKERISEDVLDRDAAVLMNLLAEREGIGYSGGAAA